MTYQCMICFENIDKPAILNLNCECLYNVHYECYEKWWSMKQTCLICRKYAGPPRSYYSFLDKKDYYFLLNLNNNNL